MPPAFFLVHYKTLYNRDRIANTLFFFFSNETVRTPFPYYTFAFNLFCVHSLCFFPLYLQTSPRRLWRLMVCITSLSKRCACFCFNLNFPFLCLQRSSTRRTCRIICARCLVHHFPPSLSSFNLYVFISIFLFSLISYLPRHTQLYLEVLFYFFFNIFFGWFQHFDSLLFLVRTHKFSCTWEVFYCLRG